MSKPLSASAASKGLTVKAYSGDCCVMLAFNLEDQLLERLAGFAVSRRLQGQTQWMPLGNRIAFEPHYSADNKTKFHSSQTDPFQKFWWLDFPGNNAFGVHEYQITVKRFKTADSIELTDDQQVTLSITVAPFTNGVVNVAFTRGYLSSQAYADQFHNKPYQPGKIDGWEFDSTPFAKQWQWLGGHARKAIFDFFAECQGVPGVTVDAFVYDLNEPDVVRALKKLGKQLRIISDDSKTHGDETAHGKAFAEIATAIGDPKGTKKRAKRGHFARFQHNKVLIKKVNGVATKVLTGSTNFSITGLYVNANHILVFDEPNIAEMYAQDFQLALDVDVKQQPFQKNALAKSEFEITNLAVMPKTVVAFAPHATPTFSLNRLQNEIMEANSSVIFSVMEMDGKSDVLDRLKKIHADKKIFSYGISDSQNADDVTIGGTTVFSPKNIGGTLVYSKANPEHFPPPFVDERQVAGIGHVIHHKFVVIDFNDTDPVVFCGSSNLANGGEEQNGDNLIAIYDATIAAAFAIEGIRLVDHYGFAAAVKAGMMGGGRLRLKTDSEKWWQSFYTAGSIKETERKLFSR